MGLKLHAASPRVTNRRGAGHLLVVAPLAGREPVRRDGRQRAQPLEELGEGPSAAIGAVQPCSGRSEIFCQIFCDMCAVTVSISLTVPSTTGSEVRSAHSAAVLAMSETSSLQ